jgi:hypothetical protein
VNVVSDLPSILIAVLYIDSALSDANPSGNTDPAILISKIAHSIYKSTRFVLQFIFSVYSSNCKAYIYTLYKNRFEYNTIDYIH